MDRTKRIGRYEIVDKLPEGGMGVLYLARDTSLGRPVALKVLAVVNEELKERFAREARAAASLKHQNIVTIYDIGEDDGRPYIAMEFIDGETLAELIRRRKPVALVQKLTWALELCSGLGYAHRKGVLHRDIKPGNLMITSEGVLKILDFGLARLMADGTTALTHAGAVLGTPHYMSPEQIEGRPLDARSDIFAVGLVLYELIGYRKAYSGDAWQAVLLKILQTEPEPLHTTVDDLDPALEAIVARCIGKSPDDRYPDLATLADDVRGVLRQLHAGMNEPTLHLDLTQGDKASHGSDSGARASTPTPSHRPNREAIARRRKEQIDKHLAAAAREFDSRNYEAAIEQCEMAIVLDPADLRTLALLDQAHRAAEDRKVREWLSQAETHLAARSLTLAAHFVQQALELQPGSEDARRLERQLRDIRSEAERQAERARAAQSAIDRARASLADEAFEAAGRSADEALSYEPENRDARNLKEAAVAGLAEQQRRLLDQKLQEALAESHRLAATFDLDAAVRVLDNSDLHHPSIEQARRDLKHRIRQQSARASSEEQAQPSITSTQSNNRRYALRRLADEETRILPPQPKRRSSAPALDETQTRAVGDIANPFAESSGAAAPPPAKRRITWWFWPSAAALALTSVAAWYAMSSHEAVRAPGEVHRTSEPSEPALLTTGGTTALEQPERQGGDQLAVGGQGSGTPSPRMLVPVPEQAPDSHERRVVAATPTDQERARSIVVPGRQPAAPGSADSASTAGVPRGARGGGATASPGGPTPLAPISVPSALPAGRSTGARQDSATLAPSTAAAPPAVSNPDGPGTQAARTGDLIERMSVRPPLPPPAPIEAAPVTPPATTDVGPQSAPVPAIDQQTVQQLLRAYAGLAGRFNVNGLRELYPGLSSTARLDTMRQNYSQCEYRFSNVRTTQSSPSNATVRVDAVESCKPKTAQRPIEITGRYEFHLVKQADGRWIFEDVFFSQ